RSGGAARVESSAEKPFRWETIGQCRIAAQRPADFQRERIGGSAEPRPPDSWRLTLADHAKAGARAAEGGTVIQPGGRTKVTRRVIPAAAAHHTIRAGLRAGGIIDRRARIIMLVVPVLAPLPEVAVHVIKTEGVGLEASHGSGVHISVVSRQVRIRD